MPTSSLSSDDTIGGILGLCVLYIMLSLAPQSASHAEPEAEDDRTATAVKAEAPVDGGKLLSDDAYFELTMRSLQVSLANTSRKTQLALDSINKELKY